MNELQVIDFAYLIKEYYPLSKQIEYQKVKRHLNWVVDLIAQDLANGESAQGQDKRFFGALQMANGLELIPLEIYLPLADWSFKLGMYISGRDL